MNRPILWTGRGRHTGVKRSRLPSTVGEYLERFVLERERYDDVIDWEARHPDTVSIHPDELERVYETVWDWAMERWPDESGRWMISRVLRRSGMITAVLERRDSGYEVGLGRTKVLVDAGTYAFIDAIEFAEMSLHPTTVFGKEEAFDGSPPP